ncbi:hypothetical protein I3843_13G041100 [Carya illinoinensis]|nr:hypothetical protein I3843_13G041100 [Carya illinoinensis]
MTKGCWVIRIHVTNRLNQVNIGRNQYRLACFEPRQTSFLRFTNPSHQCTTPLGIAVRRHYWESPFVFTNQANSLTKWWIKIECR